MKYHPLEKFGCSPCHGGNGRALDTVEKAHGRYEHWLWPLYYPENFEAGCQQCHASDMVTEHAPVLNKAKQLYREKGCIGCHRFQGFDNQDEQLVSAQQTITQLENQKQDDRLQIAQLNKKGDAATDNADGQPVLHAGHQPDRHDVGNGRADRITRPALAQPAAGNQEGRSGPERSPDEDSQGMDSVLDRAHARFPSHDENAAVPLAG